MKSISILSSLSVIGISLATYAPEYVQCSNSTPLLRLTGTSTQGNQTLNPDEVAYISSRSTLIKTAFNSYLGNNASIVYGGNLTSVPTIGISLSGGGFRAALFGAGVLSALDSRNSTSISKGTGGLLQSATYISALSGGSWALSSFIFNDFPEIYPMVLGGGNQTGWNVLVDVFGAGNSTTTHTTYVDSIIADLTLKKNAGNFNITINDYWARALSHHFLPGTSPSNLLDNSTSDHGASITFSSATQLSSWKDKSLPFPLITSDVYSPSNKDKPLPYGLEPLSNVVYEMNPIEFGSYDPQLAAFIPMASLGTAMNAGTPYGGNSVGNCVNNFDNAGFVLGTSSCLFAVYNDTNSYIWTAPISPINQAWTTVNSTFYSVQPTQQLDVAAVNNPFYSLGSGTYQDSAETQLRLVDGGISGENNPVASLSIKARALDVIIVSDASADTLFNKPNGEALIASADREALLPNGTLNLPPLPKNVATFIAKNLNIRPTFFGCQATPSKLNGTAQDPTYPIIVYLPNSDPNGITNTSTSQFVYPQASQFLDSAVEIATKGIPNSDGTADSMWSTCLACAVVERTRAKAGLDQTTTCTSCFTKYCWDGIESNVNVAGGNGTTSNGTTTGGTNSTSSSGSGSSTTGSTSGSDKIQVGLVVAFIAVASSLLV